VAMQAADEGRKGAHTATVGMDRGRVKGAPTSPERRRGKARAGQRPRKVGARICGTVTRFRQNPARAGILDQLTWSCQVCRMSRVNVAEAKARLSELIDAALRGEEVVIARRNEPLVRLAVIKKGGRRPRFGQLKGRIQMAEDFDEPLAGFEPYMPPVRRGR
jgi:prevent-host-death family protein